MHSIVLIYETNLYDVVRYIIESPIPKLLVIAGIVLIGLAVLGEWREKFKIIDTWRKVSFIMGCILLVTGMVLFVIGGSAPSQEVAKKNANEISTPVVTPSAVVEQIDPSWIKIATISEADHSYFKRGDLVEIAYLTETPDKSNQEAPRLYEIKDDKKYLIPRGRIGNRSRIRIVGDSKIINYDKYWPVKIDPPCYISNESVSTKGYDGKYLKIAEWDKASNFVKIVYPYSTIEDDADKFTTGGRCYKEPSVISSIVAVFYALKTGNQLKEYTLLKMDSATPISKLRVDGSSVNWYKVTFGEQPYWISEGASSGDGRPKYLKRAT